MIIKYLAPIFCNPAVWIITVIILAVFLWPILQTILRRLPKRVVLHSLLMVLIVVAAALIYVLGIGFCVGLHWFGW